VPTPKIEPPSPADVARLIGLAAERDGGLAAFLFLAAVTGARRSELVALQWADLDLERGVVQIRRGVVLGRRGIVEKDTKTHAVRRVALDPGAVKYLVAHRDRSEHVARMCGIVLDGSGFVFSHEPDGSRTASALMAAMERLSPTPCDPEAPRQNALMVLGCPPPAIAPGSTVQLLA
jgi:integrase